LLAAPTNGAASDGRLRHLGISVLDWQFANRDARPADIDFYLTKICSAVMSLREAEPELEVEIFPQVTVGKGLGDQEISEKLCRLIGAPWARVTSLENCAFPDDIIHQYGRMDAFVGSRMHSAILALCAGTPTVALAYQPKTTGTFEAIGLDEFSLDIVSFTGGDLAERLRRALQFRPRIQQAVAAARLSIQTTLESVFREKVLR
jgi:colanic acid/amylovoran biosynthesis protein